MRTFQLLIELQRLELPRSAIAVLQGTESERLEEIEVLRIVQLETQCRFGDARLAIPEHLQCPVGQNIEQRRTKYACILITQQQRAKFPNRDLQQRIGRFEGCLVVRDHPFHVSALRPCIRIVRGCA